MRFFFAVLSLAAAGCTTEPLDFGAQCSLNSDCRDPLACIYQYCRNRCADDDDCPLFGFCAVDNEGFGWCLTQPESQCESDRSCWSTLECAGGVCRLPCADDSVCLRSQFCIDGHCTEPDGPVGDAGVPPDGSVPDAAVCGDPLFDCNGDTMDGCETDVTDDAMHCGRCDNRCPAVGARGFPACEARACTIGCQAGYGDCNVMSADGCETDVERDEENCGDCEYPCTGACIASGCVDHAVMGRGTMPFEPMGDISIAPGTSHFTSIHIRKGDTVTIGPGTGVLELIATGDVIIDGTIDVSGGPGVLPTGIGIGASGGTTGRPLTPPAVACGGAPGEGGRGAPGTNAPGAAFGCGLGGRNGGGMSGSHGAVPMTFAGGGGGGGYAGGGGGGGPTHPGGDGASAGGSSGGAGGAMCEGGRGGVAPGVYAGDDGTGACSGFMSSGGGGGSIGAAAAGDLAVATTFYPGSGGGGGSARDTGTGGGGGGGGGGAIRIASYTRIVVNGSILARGGDGGGAPSNAVSGGGGGSGGVVYLAAPEIYVPSGGVIDVDGGAGGFAELRSGGDGGVGRIRLSTDPGACLLEGDFGTLTADCALTDPPAAGEVFVGLYPN